MGPAVGIEIRKAEARDLPDFLGALAQLSHTTPLDPESKNVPKVWEQIQSQPHRELLVAEVDGRVVGTIDSYLTFNLTHDARPYIRSRTSWLTPHTGVVG